MRIWFSSYIVKIEFCFTDQISPLKKLITKAGNTEKQPCLMMTIAFVVGAIRDCLAFCNGI